MKKRDGTGKYEGLNESRCRSPPPKERELDRQPLRNTLNAVPF